MPANDPYRQLCERYGDDVPLFHQAWWLDAVAGPEGWRGLVSEQTYRDRPALWPLYPRRRRGLGTLHRPPLTPYQGIYQLGSDSLSPEEQREAAARIWPALLRSAPYAASLRQTFYPEISDMEPCRRAGYAVRERVTYVLPLSDGPASIAAGYRRDTRRAVRRYVDQYSLRPSDDIAAFYRLVEPVYARQSLNVPYGKEGLTHLFRAAAERGQIRLWLLDDASHRPQAGLLLLHDRRCVYLLASGLTEEGRRSGAMPVLLHLTFAELAPTERVFDFCGSRHPGIAAFNRSFGAAPRAYWEIGRRRGVGKIRELW